MINKQAHINKLQRYLAQANSYEQWSEIAQTLDDAQDHQQWKLDPYSDIYNFEVLSERMHALRNLRLENDIVVRDQGFDDLMGDIPLDAEAIEDAMND